MSLIISLDTPMVSIAEYARRCGTTVNAVRKQCENGQLPFVQNGTGGTRFINMVQLTQRCAEENANSAWNR